MLLLINELGYDDAISLVADVEGTSQPNKVIVLSVKQALKERVDISQYDGREAGRIIDRVEGLVPMGPMNDMQDAKQEAPARKGLFSKGAKAMASGEGKPMKPANHPSVSINTGTATTQAPRIKNILDTYAESAAKELRKAVPQKARPQNDVAQAQKSTTHGMVMPSLSLADQIAELDRIGLGLDGNVFNSEQLKLIGMELKALKISSMNENGAKTDANLVAIRDKKLKEVEGKLGNRG